MGEAKDSCQTCEYGLKYIGFWVGSSVGSSTCLLSRLSWVRSPPDPPKDFRHQTEVF